MLYTVKEIAKLTGVTVKTLHHYHKIGLLLPSEISDAGYRLYGIKELERLQQILFYRELDFSLKDIKRAIEDQPSRLKCLVKQEELLFARKQRLDCLLKTIEKSIVMERKGKIMDKSTMFQGLNKEEWKEALSEQKEYLKDKYDYDMMLNKEIEPEEMNKNAAEAHRLMSNMAQALKAGWKASDDRVQKFIGDHIKHLNENIISSDSKTFAAQCRFF